MKMRLILYLLFWGISLGVCFIFPSCKTTGSEMFVSLETIQLTESEEGQIKGMEWSSDKKQVAFVKTKEEGGRRINSLWVINRDGSNERKLIEMPEAQWGGWGHTFHWAPDNKRIGFLVNSEVTIDLPERIYSPNSIKTIDVKTGKIEELISAEDDLGEFSWSPDGKKFVYWKGAEIWISSPDGKDRRKLVSTLRKREEWVSTHLGEGENEIIGFEDDSPFIWSPDSTKFLLGLRASETSYIFQVDILKSAFESLPDFPQYSDIDKFLPQWSPNNKDIFFVSHDYTEVDDEYAIWMFDIKTKSKKRLTKTSSPFSCSPDGKKIAFWREEMEKTEGKKTEGTEKTEEIEVPLPVIPPEISDSEFIKFIEKELKKNPPIFEIVPIEELPQSKYYMYIMDIGSRQAQKLPIEGYFESDLVWISEDTISYIKAGHICLLKLRR